MYTKTQLEAIRIFGRKELNAGCIAKWKGQENITDIIAYRIGDTLGVVTYYEGNGVNVERIEEFSIDEYEILGHEPHLEDVFRVAYDKKKRITIEYYTQGPHLIINPIEFNLRNPERIEYNQTLPLLEQSEETLQQIISLFE